MIDVYFYYDKLHMVVMSGKHPGSTVMIDKDLQVYSSNYYDTDSYQKELTHWMHSSEPFPSLVSNWEGYGTYSP